MKLNFRKRGLSKQIKRRIGLLSVLFIAAFLISVYLLNLNIGTGLSFASANATLPTITISSQGKTLGRFYGYLLPMDTSRMMGPLIPIDSSRNIVLNVETYGQSIDEVGYQILSMDGERMIADEKVSDFSRQGNLMSADITLSTLVEPDVPYMMVTRIASGGRDINFYSRIFNAKNRNEMKCLEFARYFCDTALSDDYDELALYMEPKSSKAQDIGYVTINSSLNEVGWKDFPVSRVKEPEASFSEIDTNYVALNLNYEVVHDEDGITAYYNVEEYYRMRYGTQRVYLLDFERRLTKVFNESAVSFTEGELILGQNPGDISFTPNRTGSIAVFTWDGSLYMYDTARSVLSRIYHSGDADAEDPRFSNNNHDIHVINIDEAGNVDFAVYGYMSNGSHEGYSGIGIYHYEIDRQVTRELGFVASDIPPEALMVGFDGRVYNTSDDTMYFALESELLKSKEGDENVEILADSRGGSSFKLSEDGRYMAICDDEAGIIKVTDLYAGSDRYIEAPEGKCLRVVDFLGEHLTYGIIDMTFYTPENIDAQIFPMEEIIIADITSGEENILKNYSKPGHYITGVTKNSSYSMMLYLSIYNGEAFIADGSDSVQNVAGLREVNTYTEKKSYREGSVLAIKSRGESLKNAITFTGFDKTPISKDEESAIRVVASNKTDIRYYAYKGLRPLISDDHITACISKSSDYMGYCVDSTGSKVWQYGRGSYRRSMSPESLMDIGEKRRIDLTGTGLEQILPYVYKSQAVFFNKNRENALIITGFDNNYITIYEIETGVTGRLLKDEATNSMYFQGNRFEVYTSENI